MLRHTYIVRDGEGIHALYGLSVNPWRKDV